MPIEEGVASRPVKATEKSSGKAAGKNDTPFMRQYLAAKAKHPTALLFFRMGDFYELFFEDAVTASKALDLTLTARNKGSADEVPMAGVPHHAASPYIQKLLDRNFKVAICEQMADPATVKGIVPREVVRVATPGIPFDDAAVDGRKNLYIACIEGEGEDVGASIFDASTGELWVVSASDAEAAVDALLRFSPRELLLGPGVDVRAPLAFALPGASFTEDTTELENVPLPASIADASADWPRATRRAVGRLLRYAAAADPKAPEPFLRESESQSAAGSTQALLDIDQTTREHLELVASPAGSEATLLALVDDTSTHAGARLMRHWLVAPLCDRREITDRHDAVAHFFERPRLRDDLRRLLEGTGDLERLSTKVATGRISPRELGRVRDTLAQLPLIRALLTEDPSAKPPPLLKAEAIDDLDDVYRLLGAALVEDPPMRMGDGEVLREGYDRELDEHTKMARDGQSFMEALESDLQRETQISNLKIRYTRVFGWYLEVTKTNLDKVPSDWRRKQTVASGERYTSARLDDLESRLTLAEDRKRRRQETVFADLVVKLAGNITRLRSVSHTLARVDALQSLAHVAHRRGYVRPEIADDARLEIRGGRHPVVEAHVPSGTFVANDITLDASEDAKAGSARLLLVTGPNMSGKSTYMRQIATITLLAQMGSFVPATHAHIGLVDRILTRVGASDNLARGESTFMVEMKETARIMRSATARSLVLLDEIGRGTSTYDGLAIAWAVAEYLHNTLACRALFATHYHELTAVTESCPHARNVSVSAREHRGKIVFLHAVEDGPASRSYGVACARLAGLPEGVLHRAETLLAELESRRDAAHAHDAAGAPTSQLALFHDSGEASSPKGSPRAPELDPIHQLVDGVDPDALTPRAALEWIYALKRAREVRS